MNMIKNFILDAAKAVTTLVVSSAVMLTTQANGWLAENAVGIEIGLNQETFTSFVSAALVAGFAYLVPNRGAS